jgi:hypothetical protein
LFDIIGLNTEQKVVGREQVSGETERERESERARERESERARERCCKWLVVMVINFSIGENIYDGNSVLILDH